MEYTCESISIGFSVEDSRERLERPLIGELNIVSVSVQIAAAGELEMSSKALLNAACGV